jgi:hypothetical protein
MNPSTVEALYAVFLNDCVNACGHNFNQGDIISTDFVLVPIKTSVTIKIRCGPARGVFLTRRKQLSEYIKFPVDDKKQNRETVLLGTVVQWVH